MKPNIVETEIRGTKFSISTGELAKQASGSVLVRHGDTVVLVAVVGDAEAIEEKDFFPLTVEYRERTYAAGKIPGGFFKREGRPTEQETLAARLIDRPLRPLFPESFNHEVQISVMVLSVDQENDPSLLGIIGASAALTLSDIPFLEPVGAVRVGLINGELVLNPTAKELEESALNLVLAGTREGVVMVEGGARELPEVTLVEAIELGQQTIVKLVELQEELRSKAGKEKRQIKEREPNSGLETLIRGFVLEKIRAVLIEPGKFKRQEGINAILQECQAYVKGQLEVDEKQVISIFQQIEREEVRGLIVKKSLRVDGRGLRDIRHISSQVGVLPRTHGSALFTRGETQALVVTTLGTAGDEQIIDGLEGRSSKKFILHYNFPSFSVGEVKPFRSPGRREVGHGALAERAIQPVLPKNEDFPYTIRIVSDILESNGSSSMATVCGASLSLMDAGVSIEAAVGGIAMGLIQEDNQVFIISDILGVEDHLGDMDFKVAGTAQGITALQMDIKGVRLNHEVLLQALEQAREGRLYILEKMNQALSEPRPQLSVYAPRIVTIKVKSDKIREVIGPGGKTIKGIIEKTGVSIDIEDSGLIKIASANEEAVQKAIDIIKDLTQEAEIGKIYQGRVKKIIDDLGAIVEIFPGTSGLVHISQIARRRVAKVSDELREGEDILVKLMDIDDRGRLRLSAKEVLGQSEAIQAR
ncbi:MAG: polyribonucleotide nucleotidyltransferase [Nitrospinae bacterium RIFCSPLOWO2_12_FULL_45_22]|nr:MAG: polyribonucleotide nucleotidyltransferase [Nitrospinae bacterium RIFCSPLOWO2_12_FULL_45_22]